jgi:serine/threonine protein kinase
MAGIAPQIPGCRDLSLIGERVARSLFSATSDRLGRPVTVIAYPPLSEGRSEADFDRAAATAQRLGVHPSMISIHDWGHADDRRPWIVTDPQPAEALDTVLKQGGPLEIERALQMGILLAGALETSHGAGIVHGDLSPARLVVGPHGEPLMTETGLAPFAVFPGLSALNNPVRYHAPPEVLEGTEITPATDVYSLATTVYALIAGRAPQEKPADVTDSNASLLLRVLQMAVPRIERRDLPSGLLDALRSPLAPDPRKRPQQAIEVAWLLQDVQRRAGFAITEPVVLDLDDIEHHRSRRAGSYPAPASAPAPALAEPPAGEPAPSQWGTWSGPIDLDGPAVPVEERASAGLWTPPPLPDLPPQSLPPRLAAAFAFPDAPEGTPESTTDEAANRPATIFPFAVADEPEAPGEGATLWPSSWPGGQAAGRSDEELPAWARSPAPPSNGAAPPAPEHTVPPAPEHTVPPAPEHTVPPAPEVGAAPAWAEPEVVEPPRPSLPKRRAPDPEPVAAAEPPPAPAPGQEGEDRPAWTHFPPPPAWAQQQDAPEPAAGTSGLPGWARARSGSEPDGKDEADPPWLPGAETSSSFAVARPPELDILPSWYTDPLPMGGNGSGNGHAVPPERKVDRPLPGSGDELRSLFGAVVGEPPPPRPPAPPQPPPEPEAFSSDPLGPPTPRPPLDMRKLADAFGPPPAALRPPSAAAAAPPARAPGAMETPFRLPRAPQEPEPPRVPPAAAPGRQAYPPPAASRTSRAPRPERESAPPAPEPEGKGPAGTGETPPVGPPALPVIVLVVVLAVLVLGILWLVIAGDDSGTPADEPAPDAVTLAPVGLTVTAVPEGDQLAWRGDAGTSYVVTVLSSTAPPQALPAAPGATALVPSAGAPAGTQRCYTVAVAPEAGGDPGPASVPACPPGVSPDAMMPAP